MKEALSGARKPDLTHVRKAMLVYISRANELGTAKGYERANFVRPTGSVKGDFERLRVYLRAGLGHIMDTLDSMERHQALDPHLTDVEGMKRAAYAADTDHPPAGTPGHDMGPSLLPHLCGAAASLNMAIEQATFFGLLPADPGHPWEQQKAPAEMQGADWQSAIAGIGSALPLYDRALETLKAYPAQPEPRSLQELSHEVAVEFFHGDRR